MKPYYQDDLVTLYHGDCADLLPNLGQFDLLLTDPPYGIAEVWKGGGGHGWGKARQETAARNVWDSATPAAEVLEAAIGRADHSVIWGGNYFPLPPSRGWLVWNKPERNFTLAEAELAWTNKDMVIRVGDFHRSDSGRFHPTQKPLALMHWCLSLFPRTRTVLDPFAGSGTTLRAAKDLSIKSVGIEIDESYCERIAKRLSQEVFDFGAPVDEVRSSGWSGTEQAFDFGSLVSSTERKES